MNTNDIHNTIGTILKPDPYVTSDVLRVHVIAAVAASQLFPGKHVERLVNGLYAEGAAPIGIVDPFLIRCVNPGEMFWLFLYPVRA